MSNFRGVYRMTGSGKKWRSLLTLPENRQIYVGVFDSEVAAAVARDRAAIRLGARVKLNFPELAEVL
jgi:hypothetical protein